MTQRDMAGYIGVTPVTLRNWRREKPKLYEIVMKGFAFEEAVKKAQTVAKSTTLKNGKTIKLENIYLLDD